jgi:hypothetical protein
MNSIVVSVFVLAPITIQASPSNAQSCDGRGFILSCPSLDGSAPAGWNFNTAELNDCSFSLHLPDGTTNNLMVVEQPPTPWGQFVYAVGASCQLTVFGYPTNGRGFVGQLECKSAKGEDSFSECANGVE